MSTDIATFSFAAFTAALPSVECLSPIATRLAPYSITFQEISDISAFNAATTHLQHIADALLNGFSQDVARPILRYTQAPILGYIYEALCDFDIEELRTAAALIDYWQFPKEWLTPIREQIAYLRFAATGKLKDEDEGEEDVCLFNRVWNIYSQLTETFACTPSGHMTTALGKFPPATLILTRTTNIFVERLLGRATMPSRSTVAEWSNLFALPENAARGGLLDLLQHYIKAGLHFNHVACRGAAYEGFYNLNTGGSIVPSRMPNSFIFDEEEASASPHYRILKWLATQGVEVDDSDGVLGLSLAHYRVTSMTLYGRDDLVDDADVVEAAETGGVGGYEEDEGEPYDDDFDY